MDMKKYLHLFVDESEKHIKNLFSLLDQLKSLDKYDKNLINEVFRASHSIKGMSSALGYESMSETANLLEDIFHHYRKTQTALDREYIPKLSEAIDILYEKLSCIKEKHIDEISSDTILKDLKNILDKLKMPSEIKQEEPGPGNMPSATIYFKKIPLSLAKAFVLIKRIKANYPETSFTPDYEDIKKGQFSGFLKISSESPGIADFLNKQISNESYIERIEFSEEESIPDKPDKKQVIKGDIALQERSQTSKHRRHPSQSKKIWLAADSLDRLISSLGQLYIHKSILQKSLQDSCSQPVKESFSNVSGIIDRIYSFIINLRMVPFKTISEEFPFIIKMVSSRQNKTVKFSIHGDNIEIDRIILEELKNPLVHILRNAVDHGIETPDERGSKGKDINGHISINVERKSEFISISIRDDGRGLDVERIKKRALELSLIDKKESVSIPDNEAIMLITRPGFTMRKEATDVSGRGVGMDIVKSTIESLGGRLIVNTEKGLFTEFILQVPLTMAIQEVVVVNNQANEFAFPSRSIMTTLLASEEDLVIDQDSLFIRHNDTLYPAYRINKSFGFSADKIDSFPLHAVLVENAPNPNIIIIDRIIETKKAVIKKLAFPMNKFNFLSAVTIDDYGKPMLIIDPLRLIRFNLVNIP